MKNSIQKYLDDEAGDILALYGDYSRKKLVDDIISNVELKKMLWRQLLGGTIGGATLSTDNFMQWDIGWWIEELIIWSIVGSVIAKQSSNPNTLLRLWKRLEKLSSLVSSSTPAVTSTVSSDTAKQEEQQ